LVAGRDPRWTLFQNHKFFKRKYYPKHTICC